MKKLDIYYGHSADTTKPGRMRVIHYIMNGPRIAQQFYLGWGDHKIRWRNCDSIAKRY